MTVTELPRLTLGDFLALPEVKPALEYFDGVVTQKVAPKAKHSRLQATVVSWVNRDAEPRRLATALPELRTTYSGASPVPDVAVYRWQRIPRDRRGEIADDVEIPPDVAVEIRSRGQTMARLRRRCSWYVAHGVAAALAVDPVQRLIEVVRPGQPVLILRAGDVLDLDDVIPGLRLAVADLFASLTFPR